MFQSMTIWINLFFLHIFCTTWIHQEITSIYCFIVYFQVQQLNPTLLRSYITPQPPLPIVGEDEDVHEFVVPGTVVAIARTTGGCNDTLVWFMEVQEVNRVKFEERDRMDSYGNVVEKGVSHISGVFLEKIDAHSNMKRTIYKKSDLQREHIIPLCKHGWREVWADPQCGRLHRHHSSHWAKRLHTFINFVFFFSFSFSF